MIGATLASVLSGLSAPSRGTAPSAEDAGRITSFGDVLERAAARSGDADMPSGEAGRSGGGEPRETLADMRWRGMTGERSERSGDPQPGEDAETGPDASGEIATATTVRVSVEPDAAQQETEKDADTTGAEAQAASEETASGDDADVEEAVSDTSERVRRKPKPTGQPVPAVAQAVQGAAEAPKQATAESPDGSGAPDRPQSMGNVASMRQALAANVSPAEADAAPDDKKLAAVAPEALPARAARPRDDAAGTPSLPAAAETGSLPDEDMVPGQKRASGSRGPTANNDARSGPVGPAPASMSAGAAAASGNGPSTSDPVSNAIPDVRAGGGREARPDTAVRGASTHADAAQPREPAASSAGAPNGSTPAVPQAQTAVPAGVPVSSAADQVAQSLASDLHEMTATRLNLLSTGTQSRTVRTMRLQLNPAELGVVNIRLQSVNGELRVHIQAESDATGRMLQDDSDAIRSALRSAGITTSDIQIQSHRTDTAQSQTFQHRDAPGQQAGGQQNRGDTSNESRQAYRDSSSGEAAYQPSGGTDTVDGDPVRDSRVVI